MTKPRAARSMRSHLLVGVQLLCLVLICYPLQAQLAWWPALGLCILGVFIATYTLLHNKLGNFGIYPEPVRTANLVTTGPYRFVRHPMYTALLCFMLGVAIYNGAWSNWFGFVGLVLVLPLKAALEEQYLREQFAGYAQYAALRARFIPGLF